MRLPIAVAMVLALPALVAQTPEGPTKPKFSDANPEMVELVMQDQWDRGIDMFGDRKATMIDFAEMAKNDEQRLAATRKLLAEGKLESGKDYRFASLVFQHSLQSSDYLLAHVLAVTAMSKGDTKARWLAAATMDRYLISIKQSQVFGTQFHQANGGEWTMEPYDQSTVSDSVRAAWCVASQAEQARILKDVREGKPFRSTNVRDCK